MKSLQSSSPTKNRQSSIYRLLGILIAAFSLASLPVQSSAADNKSKNKAPSAKARKQSSGMSRSSFSTGPGLAQEWAPTNEFKPYKQNYFLAFSHSSKPDLLPTSPNPAYQVTTPFPLQDKEIKFQISFKHALADYQNAGSLWLAYTQLAFWQAYNQTTTQPFREIVYEPELIYSLRPTGLSILNFGAVHQSLGETYPSERSWNRVYVEPGVQFSIDSDKRIILQVRWWKIIQEPSLNDNPDICNYQGYREVNLRFIQDGGWKINVMSRILSTQVDVAAPLSVWFLQSAEPASGDFVDLHLQYFNGYGEGLQEYNQSHVTVGAGLSFPF